MNLQQQLERDEGNVPHAYKDSEGYWTIGIGFLIDEAKGGGLRPEEISFIFNNRVRIHDEELEKRVPWFKDLDEPRRAVLQNMAYQMGVDGLLGFKKTLEQVRQGNYSVASDMMLQSLWAKQTPKRAQRLAKQMKTGDWQ